MDKEIREKIHFVSIRELEDTEPGQVYCNCGHKWPCPILRAYEDAENLKAGLLDPDKHVWAWYGSGLYVYEYCSICVRQRTDVGDRPCAGPVEVFTDKPGLYKFGQEKL